MYKLRLPFILLTLVASALLGGCALFEVEEDEGEPEAPRLARRPTLAPTPAATRPAAVATRQAAALEDRVLEERTPAPAGPELAALPPQIQPEGAALPPANDSLLTLIGPSTPPHVAAALRSIDEGRRLIEQDKSQQGLERVERGLTIDPGNAYGYYFLAQAHYLNRRYDQANAFVGRAVSLGARIDRPWQARIFSLQGQIFEAVGRYPEARKAYQQAISADANNPTARGGIARLSAP